MNRNCKVHNLAEEALAFKPEDHYYPIGMQMPMLNYQSANTTSNKYKYNSKLKRSGNPDQSGELQDDAFDTDGNSITDTKLDWYDYGARCYDAQLGRFHTVDPLADEFPSWMPYHYVHNNPIVLIDPTGMSADWYQSEAGNLIWQDKSDANITVNGEEFTNVGKAVSIPDIEGNYVNYYENVPISISNIPVNAENKVLNNDGLKGQLLRRNSPLSERSQMELFVSSIHKGQQDFLEHPVTKATTNTLLFVATGGIEGVVSLASSGKTAFNIIKNSRPSDWFRTGKTVVSNQIAVEAGTSGATVTWGAKGGGNLAKTGQNMGFHYHFHKYNWYKPWTWFKQTPIIKPPKP